MHGRCFFWLLLTLTCVGVLTFAFFFQKDVPTLIQLSVDHPVPKVQQVVTLSLHVTDAEGLPVNNASVISHANITAMNMQEGKHQLVSVEHGNYITHLQCSISGSWFITVSIRATGIVPTQQHFFLKAS